MVSILSFERGTILGGVVIDREIGSGGQARVYQGCYFDREVAIKVLAPASSDPDLLVKAMQRFEREQDLLLQLSHPNIVDIVSAGVEKVRRKKIHRVPYIVMELMAHPAYEYGYGALAWQKAVRIVLDAARGLHAAHELGIIHLDVKPANILLNASGTAKLSDFGLARYLELGEFSGGGTPYFASPEQHSPTLIAIDDLPAPTPDTLSDIYSLGITLYLMLMGHFPYTGPQAGLLGYLMGHSEPDPISTTLPDSLREITMRMISRRRKERPQSLAEVITVLEKLSTDKVASPHVAVSTPVSGAIGSISETIIYGTESEEAVLEQYIAAFLRPALFSRIATLKGRELGGWRVQSLYAVGGEGILFRVKHGSQHGILKMPHLPYDRPVMFGMREIIRAREELRFEGEMLARFGGKCLPVLFEMAEGKNPLLEGRPAAVVSAEQYLVMEYIPGRPLDMEWKMRSADERLPWLRHCVATILGDLALLKRETPPCFYTDFKPSNFRIRPDGKVILLDGGSIVWEGATHPVAVTPGFAPEVPATPTASDLERLSLRALARTLYAVVCNRILYERMRINYLDVIHPCSTEWALWCDNLDTPDSVLTVSDALATLP